MMKRPTSVNQAMFKVDRQARQMIHILDYVKELEQLAAQAEQYNNESYQEMRSKVKTLEREKAELIEQNKRLLLESLEKDRIPTSTRQVPPVGAVPNDRVETIQACQCPVCQLILKNHNQ
ncbi:hypothetical protein D3C74_49270 [compost metagenome]